jgi:hypothetical protein
MQFNRIPSTKCRRAAQFLRRSIFLRKYFASQKLLHLQKDPCR